MAEFHEHIAFRFLDREDRADWFAALSDSGLKSPVTADGHTHGSGCDRVALQQRAVGSGVRGCDAA